MIVHIVRQGDTIFSIANTYGVSTERIIYDNGLAGLNYLIPGQAILILFPEIVHRVKLGDTLYLITREYNITYQELLQKNPYLIFNNEIYPGQELTISFADEGNREIRIYGYLYPYINDNVFLRELPYLTSASIFSYGFTIDGDIISVDDERLINYLNLYNADPVLVLSSITEKGNFSMETSSVLFNDSNLQNTIIGKLIEIMYEKGYKGIDIDFEFIYPSDSDAFVSFVQNVTRQMNSNGFRVNVDLAPKTSDEQSGTLYEGHNYYLLGQAANTVLIMTYEWGYTYGPPMAVSPINKVREVCEYAVSRIDNEKIFMGLPNYGYDWKLPFIRGSTRADNIGNDEAVRLAIEVGAEIQFDELSQSPFFEYRDSQGNDHIVWFEDIRSIIAKCDLADEFNFRGLGYWNLMRSFAPNWSYLGYRYNIIKGI